MTQRFLIREANREEIVIRALAPCDFFLFPKLKEVVKETRF